MKTNIRYTLLLFVVSMTLAYGQVKIGNNPTTINASAALEIESANKGFLPPRVALTSSTDGTTIPNPATGLVVYNTNASMTDGNGTGLYINNGTASSPMWYSLQTASSTTGSKVYKMIQSGDFPNNTQVLVADGIELRWDPVTSGSDPGGDVAFRLTSNPGTTATITVLYQAAYVNTTLSASGYHVIFTPSYTFTSANYNQWQYLGGQGSTINAEGEIRTFRFSIPGTDKVYVVEAFGTGNSGTNRKWVMIVNVY